MATKKLGAGTAGGKTTIKKKAGAKKKAPAVKLKVSQAVEKNAALLREKLGAEYDALVARTEAMQARGISAASIAAVVDAAARQAGLKMHLGVAVIKCPKPPRPPRPPRPPKPPRH